MDINKIEKIKALIGSSPILQEAEREDWLQLITLMNDKQVSELEEILLSLPEQSFVASPLPPKPYMPPLRHISNLPSSINLPQAIPTIQAPRPQSAPAPVNTTNQFSGIRKTENQFTSLAAKPVEAPPPRPPVPQAPGSLPSAAPDSNAALNLNNLADLAKLEAKHLRSYGVASLITKLKNMVISQGYFDVLFAFEQSLLYKLYLETGKNMLGGQDVEQRPGTEQKILAKNLLSKEEFESVTDLLRKIQVN